MRYTKIVFITLLASSMLLSGCSNLSTRQKNAATGAAIGGVIGHGVDGVTSKKK